MRKHVHQDGPKMKMWIQRPKTPSLALAKQLCCNILPRLLLLFLLVQNGRKLGGGPGAIRTALGDLWTEPPSPEMPSLNLTVLILTNLVPLHPDTWFLDTTVDSLYYHMHGLPYDTPLIIAGDGPKYTTDWIMKRWQEYQANLRLKYNKSHHEFHFAETQLGISGLLRDVWPRIKTEFVMVVQHDLAFIKPIELPKVIAAFEAYPENVTMVRWNKDWNVPTTKREREWAVWKDFYNSSTPVQEFQGINFVKTAHWSDNNHLCRTSYYAKLWPIFEHHEAFTGKKRAPERIMTMDLIALDFPECERYCTHLYGAYGESPYIYHLDGRRGTKDVSFSFETYAERYKGITKHA